MTTAAAQHTGTLSEIFAWICAYWWLLFLFGGAILEFVGDVFSATAKALSRRRRTRHKHRLELKRLELEIARATVHAGETPAPAPIPGQCRHRTAVPVRDSDGHVLAWLCRACDSQLPADFSIYVEDL
jgi:hypothetical protein